MSSGELVAVEHHGNLRVDLSSMASKLTANDDSMFTTFDRSNPAEKLKLANVANHSDHLVQDVCDREFIVEHITAHDISPADPETGEIVQTVRIVFHCVDGTTVSGSGKGLYSSLRKIISVMGSPKWEPALKLVFKKVRTRLGRTTYNIEVTGYNAKESKPKKGEA